MEKNKNAKAGKASGAGAKAFERTPMPIELRAKQFMPFAAVTGLEKALREKEMKREQAEDDIAVAEQPEEL